MKRSFEETNDDVIEYNDGDLVWAKMKGYPPWPGKITVPCNDMKKSAKKNRKCVFFFGSNNYQWIHVESIKPYSTLSDKMQKKYKSLSFKNACKAIETYILDGKLPVRTERINYLENLTCDDEEFQSGSSNIQNVLKKKCTLPSFVKEMDGKDLCHSFFIERKFIFPLLFKNKSGLGLEVPSATFSVPDICRCVGSSRKIDVIDVSTQQNITMTMKEWTKYFEAPIKTKILNVISLEFSHTKLDQYVKRPNIVEELDWVDCVWPTKLIESQTESTNLINGMMYPKVRKYCLMSVKGSFTDFHIDFGGTSVWYHVLKGRKIFWLIPPTVQNLRAYKQWVLSGVQGQNYFGDILNCVELRAGHTLFLPSGWIHAVYTPEDSIVFGGNFLHSFDVENQLSVALIEKSTKVPNQFRYPFFTEMLWHVLKRYVDCALDEHRYLTELELFGLSALANYLEELPLNMLRIPFSFEIALKVMIDVGITLTKHSQKSELETSTIFLLPITKKKNRAININKTPKKVINIVASTTNSESRKRRTRCKKCEACNKDNCGNCACCLDMVVYGGSGRGKQSCVERQCLQPVLPISAVCNICKLNGWNQEIKKGIQKATTNSNTPSSLMECCVCYEVVHPACLLKPTVFNNSGIYKEDLPNSWDCPKCCKDGKNLGSKGRFFLARQKLLNIRQQSAVSSSNNQNDLENENTYSDNEASSSNALDE